MMQIPPMNGGGGRSRFLGSLLPQRNVTSPGFHTISLSAPLIVLQDSAPEGGCKLPVSIPARQRKQAGHTNRWQLPHPLGSDLLGQAQVERAVRVGINTSLRSIKTADSPPCGHHDASCGETPPPRVVRPLGTSAPTGSRHCAGHSVVHRPATPEDLYCLQFSRVVHNNQPDVILECLGSQWELHCPYLTKSGILTDLYMTCRRQRAQPHQERAGSDRDRPCSRPASCLTKGRESGPMLLKLSVEDPFITKEALSFALRTLYSPEACPERWGEAVLSAAALLGLAPLFQRCLSEMMNKISSSTVCDFHRVACKYKEASLQRACEHWLELYLVTELTCHICLRELPFELLHKTLRSPRIFASSEYHLLKTVLYWVYLQFNPSAQILPSHGSIINFFSSWPRAGVFLEQPAGQEFSVLFQALRLHGITERDHLEEIQRLHVFPQTWLLLIFAKHYYTLHSGGDMPVTDFTQQAVRFGMIVDREPQYCTQTIALYGFYFLLKASSAGESDTHGFSLQRLRHWDPVLSVRACERHPFSMLSERSVRYQITVQARVRGQWQEFSSGPVDQEFGLNERTCKSQVFKVKGLCMPILVTFALAFPSV